MIAKALAYSYLGFFERSSETSKSAEELCKKVTDNDEFYSSMGQIYAGRSEILNLQYQSPEKTIVNDLKSVGYYEKIKDVKKRNGWLAIQYSSVGYTYIDLDKHKEALYYSRKAYELAKAENNSINQAFGLYGIGNTYLEMNKTDSSIYYYKQALPIFEKPKTSTDCKTSMMTWRPSTKDWKRTNSTVTTPKSQKSSTTSSEGKKKRRQIIFPKISSRAKKSGGTRV